jgi:hypothetical protein
VNTTAAKVLRWRCKRLLLLGLLAFIVAWAALILMRLWAEHRDIPVLVMVQGPPIGPLGVQMKAAGITNVSNPVPYSQVATPRISLDEIARIKRCLARDQFLPLFPSEIEIGHEDVTAQYKMKINRRTGRTRQTVVMLVRERNAWRIERVGQLRGIADFSRPPTLWQKFVSYLPFTD